MIILVTSNNSIEYKISLIDATIEKGQDALLFFEVNNGLFSGDKYDVKLKYYILNEDSVEEKIEPIGKMGSGQTYRNTVYIDSSELSPGKYTIWTELVYYVGGKGQIKFLTVPLTIYQEQP